MERSYTDEELTHIDDHLGCTFEGRKYSAYEATQKQRSIERSIRKQKRLKAAYEEAGLTEEAQNAGIRLQRLNQQYRAFSKAAGLPLQRERMRVDYPWDITDIKKFSPLKEYQGKIQVVGQFSAKEYVVKLNPPSIAGIRGHFEENLRSRSDRAGLTVAAAQSIINNSKLVLYQSDRETLKFLSDNGYVILNMSNEIVTAVPEKLRGKYKRYLEGK